jgi:hypothetical protein
VPKTLPPPASTQEAYERIRRYFSRPSADLAKSIDLFGSTFCEYRKGRQRNGRACAVGCLIPNELYSTSLEENSVGQIFSYFPTLKEYFANVNREFLADAQNLHDDKAASAPHFVSLLDDLARDFNLTVPEGS